MANITFQRRLTTCRMSVWVLAMFRFVSNIHRGDFRKRYPGCCGGHKLRAGSHPERGSKRHYPLVGKKPSERVLYSFSADLFPNE
jgi:hypothetical protein